MQSTMSPRFVPAGGQLHAELSRLLRGGMGYTIQGAADVISHVDRLGTARDSAADVEDVQALDDLVRRHTAPVEYEDASQWPGAWDADVWATCDTEPANGPLFSEAFLAQDLEPSFEDRRAWAELSDREGRLDRELDRLADEAAALEMLMKGLDPYAMPAPVCGGAPAPEPRWDNAGGVRSRPVRGWTDADQYRAHGCV